MRYTAVMWLRPLLLLSLCLIAPALGIAPAGAWAASPGAAPEPVVTLKAPSSLWLGDTVTLRVTVEPAIPGAAVVVESMVDGAWAPLAGGSLDEASRLSLAWQPDTYGYVRLRASLEAGLDYAAAVSATKRVVVNRPNKHDVPYRFAHYVVIVVHEYRLYYYEHGRNVRTFNVALGRPGYHTPIGSFHIYAKRRPAAGPLGACVMYYHQPGGIAIHGTDQPYLLKRFPRPFSHGCARMYNSQALWLYARCPRGTPVHNIR
ncbi:MAG: L,D-transpeptidase [Actinobacteria bacterium]|nr:L,D-transpeptidase [Actinomycetota bacterium]